MRIFGRKQNRYSELGLYGWRWSVFAVIAACLVAVVPRTCAQAADEPSLDQKIQQLTDAMAKVQAQVEQSQQQLDEMRKELVELRSQMPQNGAIAAPVQADSSSNLPSAEATAQSLNAAVRDLEEHQAVLDSELATQEQTKVESESKYPVKITGMVLLNGFVNTGAVDVGADPSIALGGSGNAGASMRQTMLGIDARGPHLFGANTSADLRMDFYGSMPSTTPISTSGSTNPSNYSGLYNTNIGLFRLRTAHAGLFWDRTEIYFALDRPIVSPDTPTSLTASSVPEFSWSGNLWTWNPQVGITQKLGPPDSRGVQLQAAMIDVGDAPLTPPTLPTGSSNPTPPSSAEQSSRPGVEARVALQGSGQENDRNQIGAGGYFATHTSALGNKFDSWAATMDARLQLASHLQFSGSAYRGLALGGLGGGAYKDFSYSPNTTTGGYYFRVLNDVGGWAQLKEKVNERLEFNEAYGIDNAFVGDLRRYFVYDGSMAQNLARNRTFTSNVIYSPSAYLLFSLEYRYLESAPILGAPAVSNIFGVAAGYKF